MTNHDAIDSTKMLARGAMPGGESRVPIGTTAIARLSLRHGRVEPAGRAEDVREALGLGQLVRAQLLFAAGEAEAVERHEQVRREGSASTAGRRPDGTRPRAQQRDSRRQ